MRISELQIRLRSSVFLLTTFQVRVRFVVTKRAFIALEGPEAKADVERTVGITVLREDGFLGLEIAIGVFDNQLDTLIHETTHAALKILDHHRVRTHGAGEEVLCLLIEDIVRQVLAAARHEKKRKR